MDDNTCSICLEPLLGADGKKIGTTVPCGHCFHEECFSMWQATRGRSCKCPNCNVVSKKFVALFLSVGEANGLGGDDDDLSLSSAEGNDDNDDEPDPEDQDNDDEQQQESNNNVASSQQNQARGAQTQETITIDDDDDDENDIDAQYAQPQRPTSSASRYAENDDDDSVQVVDLTMSPERSPPARRVTVETSSSSRAAKCQARAASSSQKSNNEAEGDDQTERFKKIAKKYKRKFQQKQSQCQEQYKQHQELVGKMKDVQTASDAKDCKLEDLEKQAHYYQLEISNLQLIDVRRSNDLKEKVRQVARLTSDVQRVTSEYTKLKANYERDLSHAHSSSTAEVKELAARTKDLEQENARLRAAMSRGGVVKSVDPMDSLLQKTKKVKKQQSNNDVIKALRGMDAVRTIPGSSKRKAEDEPTTYDTSRYSAQAARINLAAGQQKKRKNPLSVAAAEMLNANNRPKPQTTSLNMNKSRRPLQRMNSHEPSTPTTQKKTSPQMASIFQRR